MKKSLVGGTREGTFSAFKPWSIEKQLVRNLMFVCRTLIIKFTVVRLCLQEPNLIFKLL